MKNSIKIIGTTSAIITAMFIFAPQSTFAEEKDLSLTTQDKSLSSSDSIAEEQQLNSNQTEEHFQPNLPSDNTLEPNAMDNPMADRDRGREGGGGRSWDHGRGGRWGHGGGRDWDHDRGGGRWGRGDWDRDRWGRGGGWYYDRDGGYWYNGRHYRRGYVPSYCYWWPYTPECRFYWDWY